MEELLCMCSISWCVMLPFFVTVWHLLNFFQFLIYFNSDFFDRLLLSQSFHILHSCSWLLLSKVKKLSVYAECIPLIFWESVSLWCSECQFNPLVIKSSRKTNKQNQKPPYQFSELNWSGGSKQCQSQTKARTFGSQEQGKGSEITVFQQHQAVRSAVQETQALVSSWNLIMLVPSH